MIKLFKKKKEEWCVVGVSLLSLCKGYEVARFKNKKDAQEYVDYKNATNDDPDLEWSIWY